MTSRNIMLYFNRMLNFNDLQQDALRKIFGEALFTNTKYTSNPSEIIDKCMQWCAEHQFTLNIIPRERYNKVRCSIYSPYPENKTVKVTADTWYEAIILACISMSRVKKDGRLS